MRAGKLRHWIYIEEATATVGASRGQVTKTWTVLHYVPASITPIRQAERHVSQQLRTSVTHTITLRFISGLNTKMRVRFLETPKADARLFDIRGIIDPDERRTRLVMDAEEIA